MSGVAFAIQRPRPQLNPPVNNKETYPGRHSASGTTDTSAPSEAEIWRATPKTSQTHKMPPRENPGEKCGLVLGTVAKIFLLNA